VLTLAWVVMVFAGSDFLAHESGLLAVTIMGVWLGNMRDVAVNEILSFKESLSILIISMLFVVLGARVSPDEVIALGWQGILCCWWCCWRATWSWSGWRPWAAVTAGSRRH
jgi:NhaP-type Na+/H+ and K+/H+ antiporter